MSLESKVLHNLPARRRSNGPSAHTSASGRDRVGGFTLTSRCCRNLALDLLHACGMIQQSEERLLGGCEVQGSRTRLAIARASKDSTASSLAGRSAKNTRYVVPGLETMFPLVNPFRVTLRLNEKTWLPRSVY